MVRIQIDGKQYEVKPGNNLLETCLSLGIYVPHFCYHGAMGSVGACRLCAVTKYRNTDDQTGRIVMSCMEPVADGLIINVNDPEAVAFRAAIIESLMTNHPHDCPVCDEGGECHLQDMTVMTGHNYRRFDFKKRTHTNQELGPFINHEMNRCIQCYRCVRFYNDYAGGTDLAVFGAHDHVYFGRHESGTLESEFSGNLVEVCPTGVFTDKTLKEHYTRKWDLTNSPTVCVHCSLGCNTIAGERYGGLRRIMSRYNGAVNGYFLCDRGRFGYEFVNDDQRIKKAEIRERKDGTPQIVPEEINKVLAREFSSTKRWIGIGSPRASLEANFALASLVGKENFYHGVSQKDYSLINKIINILNTCSAHIPSLKDIEKADAVLILGEDITNTAPMTALAVRQASRNIEKEIAKKAGIPEWNDIARREKAQGVKIPIFITSSFGTKLDEIAEITYQAAPMDLAVLGYAIASLLTEKTASLEETDGAQNDLAQRIALALQGAKAPLIIAGTHSGNMELIHAAANIAKELSRNSQKPMLSFILPECNSMGLGMMEGDPFENSISGLKNGDNTGLIILENDLYRRADKAFVDSLMEKFNPVIVLDHSTNETTEKADIVLPVGTFAESDGTLVSNEGRAQRFYRVFPPDGSVIESWRLIRDLFRFDKNRDEGTWLEFDDVVNSMIDQIPAFSKIKGHNPVADFSLLNEKIKRQTIRFSGRTAIKAGIAVSEPKIPSDPGSPLAFSMEGRDENPPSSLVPYYWVPGWNSYQAVNFYLDEPNGSMKGGDPGIRLIDPSDEGRFPLFDPIATPFKAKKGEWLLVPVYRIFGSEELSAKSRSVRERIGIPFIVMNAVEAAESGWNPGDQITMKIKDQNIEVQLRTEKQIPAGLAAISAGLPGMPFMDLPEWGTLTKKS